MATVTKIDARVNAFATYSLLTDQGPVALDSASPDIAIALTVALILRADVAVEATKDTSFVRRVNALQVEGLDAGKSVPGWYVDRLATQRFSDVSDHLEVFLKRDGSDDAVTPNVYDPYLKALFHGIALAHARFDATFDADNPAVLERVILRAAPPPPPKAPGPTKAGKMPGHA